MIANKRENLLVVCAGDNSLHTAWYEHRQSFDIITIYYGNNQAIADTFKKTSDLFYQLRGQKTELARNVLFKDLMVQNKFNFSDYNFVWFPDDDLKFYNGDQEIETLFKTASETRADFFQPAVENIENTSHYWGTVRQVKNIYAHRVNIVELMAGGFSGEVFEKCYLPGIHTCDFWKAGWGVEIISMKLAEALYRRSPNTYVFDQCPITHTRPLGKGDSAVHRLGAYELKYVPQLLTNPPKTLATYNDLTSLLADQNTNIDFDNSMVEQFHKARLPSY
jgi:hypothetical protein